MTKENSCQNETSPKMVNARTNTFRDRQSGGAGGQFKPKSGCFVCGSLNHKAFSCPQRSNPQNQNRGEQGRQQPRVVACQLVEDDYNLTYNCHVLSLKPCLNNVSANKIMQLKSDICKWNSGLFPPTDKNTAKTDCIHG